MKANPNLLIFDLDGTLADTKDDITLAVNLTLEEVGLPPKPAETIHGYVGSGIRRLLQQAVGEETGPTIQATLAVFRRHYMAHFLDRTRLYDGINQVLSTFSNRRRAVATNKAQVYTDPILKGLGVFDCFDVVLAADNGYRLKPDPHMIVEILRRLNVASGDAVMIGDSLLDLDAARAAGVAVCAVGYGFGDSTELKSSVPDFFAESVLDLVRLFK